MEKLTVSNFSSKLTDADVTFLMKRANISPTEFQFLVPKNGDRANNPPEGYISVYKQQIVRGLRFPLHALVLEICNRMRIPPTQLSSDSHCAIVGFILCAKLYNIPVTADCFFSLFTATKWPDSEGFMLLQPVSSLNFLEMKFPLGDGWKRKFFFLRPVGKSWNCVTKWNGSFSGPEIDAVSRTYFQDLVLKSGMVKCRFRVSELIGKDVLVRGGIEPRLSSPQFTFRYLMHRAAVTKFELLPGDIPPATPTNKAVMKRPLSSDANNSNTLRDGFAPPSTPKVPVPYVSSSSVSNSSSTLTEDEVSFLMRRANISSSNYEFLVPSKDDRANQPPKGYISVYKQQIAWGLRFPLHELVVEICSRMKVSPSQLRSIAHCTIVGFILSAKLHNIPVTADCFFSLFTATKSLDSEELISIHPISGLNFLERKVSFSDGWKRKFFFLRPVGKSWNCLTKWSKTFSSPKLDAVVRDPFIKLALKSGMINNRIRLNELIEKDVLVHGGIEHGDPSPQFTFRYLMHRAALTKFKLLPEDIPPANATIKTANKRPLSGDANNSNASAYNSAAPSLSEVPIHDVSSSSEDTVPSKEIFHKGKEASSAAHKNRAVAVSNDDASQVQFQALPAPLLAIWTTVESMFVSRECYEKLEKEKQEVSSEFKLRVEELEQEIKLHKAKRIDSDYRASQAMIKVKMLEKRLEKLKSDSDKILKDAIEAFKSSDDFTNAVQEEAVKYYMDGFEACKLQVLNSGKLPGGFYLDSFDAPDAEWCNSIGPVDNDTTDQDIKPFKRNKT